MIFHGYVSCTGGYLAHPDDEVKREHRHPVIPPEVRCLDGMFLGSKYRASGGGSGCLQPLRCNFIALKGPSIQSLPCSMANMHENTCEVGEKRIPKPPKRNTKKTAIREIWGPFETHRSESRWRNSTPKFGGDL